MNVDLWTYRCRLVRVVDGDTILLAIDQGFRNTTTQSIRLVGVDAPEINSGTLEERALGIKAKDCVQIWCWEWERTHPSDWPWIVTTERDRQSFARYLGRVWTADGESLNEYLASEPWVVT